jgi:hypothetical protein
MDRRRPQPIVSRGFGPNKFASYPSADGERAARRD